MPSSASSRKADDYESPANILGEPYVLKTLLYLFDHGSSKKTDLYENVSRNLATRHRLDAMSEAGLIDVNRMGNVTLTIVSLTDTGRAVVEKLSWRSSARSRPSWRPISPGRKARPDRSPTAPCRGTPRPGTQCSPCL